MNALIDFYQQQATSCRSDIAWLAKIQETALADFLRLNFPTRQHEEWKYTPLDTFVQQPFSVARSHAEASVSEKSSLATEFRICLTNGQYIGLERLSKQLPGGVIIKPLSQACIDHADLLQAHLSRMLRHEHGFHALNTAMLQTGLFIYWPAGVSIHAPILIEHWQDVAMQAMHIRHLIVAEEGSSATIIEDYQGDSSVCYLTNVVTEVAAATDAHLTHYKMQRESKAAYHFGQISVKQAEGSTFNSHLLSVGGQLVRNDIAIQLFEPHAHCLMNGLYLPNEGQHMDQHTLVSHEVADCTSEQDYKGILIGRSRGVFSGKVFVAKDAQRTSAKQKNKNLLLSTAAEINTKPQLDIYADDVVCTHGATVGQLDEEALFYLATRGINHEEASRYLMQAFVMENLRAIPHAELAEWVGTAFTQACMPSELIKG